MPLKRGIGFNLTESSDQGGKGKLYKSVSFFLNFPGPGDKDDQRSPEPFFICLLGRADGSR
jgi:hypothetical protein